MKHEAIRENVWSLLLTSVFLLYEHVQFWAIFIVRQNHIRVLRKRLFWRAYTRKKEYIFRRSLPLTYLNGNRLDELMRKRPNNTPS